ncbi:unnamed protein product [Malus baccata var. baccata]
MAGSSGSDLRAPIFNGHNYEFWKIRMRTIFKSHGIWDLTSKGAWDILHQEFHGDKQVKSIKLQGLRHDFKYTRMRDDETLFVYLTRFLELLNQMKSYGEDLPRERLVQKLLISLTKEFDLVCYVIEQTKDIETIEVQEVIAALKGFAQRLDRHVESINEKAFSSMSVNPKGTQSNPSFGNSKPKKNWKSKGKKWDPKPQNSVNQGGKYDKGGKPDQAKGKCKHCDKLHYRECWFKGKPKCHGCNRFGHFIKDCDQPNKAGKLVKFANQVTEPATMFYDCRHSATIGRNMNIWYVDSACSNHMTSHKSLLIDVNKNVKCALEI